MSKRRVLTEIGLDKIAAVDEPCQTPARMAIIKRRWTAQERKDAVDKGHAMPGGGYPIETKADLEDAVRAFGRAKDPEATRRHIISRAKALGATDQLPQDWNVKKAGNPSDSNQRGSNMDLKKFLGLPDSATEQEVEAAMAKRKQDEEALRTNLAKANDRADEAIALAGMSDLQKAHYGTLANETDDDRKVRKSFRDMSGNDRDEEIRKAKGGDESYTTASGITITKRAAGPMFEVMKAMDADLRKTREETGIVKAQAETATIQAEIAKSFSHVPGDVDSKVLILKSARTLPKAAGDAILGLMKAAETLGRDFFIEKGRKGGTDEMNDNDEDDPQEKAMKKIRELAKSKGISEAKATEMFMDSPEFAEMMRGAEL